MLELEFTTHGRRWQADLSAPVDLAVTLRFPGPQPRFFAPGPASAEPLQVDGFTGTIASGASCNCGVYTLAPHCHGTHTECVAHVTDNAADLAQLTPLPPALALLVSVRPVPLGDATMRSRAAGTSRTDPVITRVIAGRRRGALGARPVDRAGRAHAAERPGQAAS